MSGGARLAVLAVARAGGLAGALPPEVRVLADGAAWAALCVDPGRVPDGLARLRLMQRIEEGIGALLPVAAGCAAPDGVRAWLRAERAALAAGLARVSGCREIVLTLSDAADPPVAPTLRSGAAPPAGGRAWLRARAAEAHAGAAARDRLLRAAFTLVAATGGGWRAALAEPFGHPVRGLDIVLLVPQGSAAGLARRLAEAGPERFGAGIAVRGPWPCYAFGAVAPRPPGTDAGAAA